MAKFVDLDETVAQLMFTDAFKAALRSFPGITNPGAGGGAGGGTGGNGGGSSPGSSSQTPSNVNVPGGSQSGTFQGAVDLSLSALNKLLIVLPFLPHTQHWNGLNPFLFSVKLTSSFGLW